MPKENRGVAYRQESQRQGFVMLPWVVITSRMLTWSAKGVYAGLLHYARQDDACFPGQEKLVVELGMSLSTIQRGIRELETMGLVTTEQRGLGQTNVYWIEPLTDEVVEALHPQVGAFLSSE